MAGKKFKAKVEQLEQLKVQFDDANSADNQGALPQQVNSKTKFDVGPSNNPRSNFIKRKNQVQKETNGGVTFGFKERDDNGSQDEETKNSGIANRIFHPAQVKNSSQVGEACSSQSLMGGQMTITKMVRQFKEIHSTEQPKKRTLTEMPMFQVTPKAE